MANQVALMTADGEHYVSAEDGGRKPLVANRRAIGAWEVFTIEASPGNGIALQAVNGLWVCAEGGGGRELIANRSQVGAWETFTVVDMGGGHVALRAANGQFVCAEGGGGGVVLANRDAAGAWETFRMVPTGTAVDAGPPPGPNLPPPQPAPERSAVGGFLEHAASAAARPRLTRAAIAALLPDRGAFRFPDPYNTIGIRLTNERDGAILPVGYSYWRNINQHRGRGSLLVFLGTASGQPILIEVDKASRAVTNHGAIGNLHGTGEGWYFSATHPTRLIMTSGARLLAHDVESGAAETIFEVGGGRMLWQMSSSDDDQAHAGTVRDAQSHTDLGCVVFRRGTQTFYEKREGYDECQIDKSGRWLIIKEAGGWTNRVIDLDTGAERLLGKGEGSIGHSDTGHGVMIGEDRDHEPGALVAWNLDAPFSPDRRRLLYHRTQWNTGLGHVAVAGQRVLVSCAHRADLPCVNELIDVPMDGSLNARVVAPNLVDLDGGGGSDYDKMPKANLDPTGQYACWTANAGTSRLDAFLVELP